MNKQAISAAPRATTYVCQQLAIENGSKKSENIGKVQVDDSESGILCYIKCWTRILGRIQTLFETYMISTTKNSLPLSASFSTSLADTTPLQVSYRLLLGIYLIFPASVLIYLADQFYFNQTLKYSLPVAPEHYFWLGLLFGTPHIVASNVIMFSNREYMKLYWRRIVGATVAIIAFFGIGNYVLSYNILFALVASATVIHVVKQQIGIGNSLARLKGWKFNLWSWSVIGSGILLYNAIFLRRIFSVEQKAWFFNSLAALSVLILFLALLVHKKIKPGLPRAFFWANTCMSFFSFFFYSQEYYFFAILGPRVTHDVTAFIFYVVHDANRHKKGAQNFVYRCFNAISAPTWLTVPVVAIALTYWLHQYGDALFNQFSTWSFNMVVPGAISFGFIGYLSMLHYYAESFTWKGPSPYRKYISFRNP